MLLASASRGNINSGNKTMNNKYRPGDIRHTVAAVACAIVLGSTFLLGAIAPAQATPAALYIQTTA